MDTFRTILMIGVLVFSGCAYSGIQDSSTGNPEAQADLHRDQGRQAFNQGNFEEAARHLEQARQLETGPSETNTLLGLTYSAMNNHQKAAEVLGEGPHLPTPEHAFALGSALIGAGKTTQGVSWLKQAVHMDPKLATLYQVSDGTADPQAAVKFVQEQTRTQQVQEEVLETILQDTKDQIRQDIREAIAEDLILGR